MDKSSIIGVILAIIAVGVGMVFKGVSPSALVNPAAILIIIVGTVAAVTIAFPANELKKVPKLFGILFKEKETVDLPALIRLFSEWAQLARKEGLLALEAKTSEVDDEFLKNGLSLAVDGQSAGAKRPGEGLRTCRLRWKPLISLLRRQLLPMGEAAPHV